MRWIKLWIWRNNGEGAIMKHTVSVVVENKFGVLARVAGLFSARGYNIDSLAVGETEDSSISRMTIVTSGDDRVIQQIISQLSKLIDVIKVFDLKEDDKIERELLMIKVKPTAKSRNDVMQIVNTFRAKIVDVNTETITIEVTGTTGKVDALLELLRPYGIKEVSRTGTIALARRGDLSLARALRKEKKSKKR
jgi:acetolactate synthase-1/3 small subunit